MWITQKDDIRIPDWLSMNLKSTCDYCGTEKENYYNANGRCTNRRCPNTTCPATLAKKAESMFKILNVKGLGFKTALNAIKANGYKSHFDCLALCAEGERKVSLGTYLRLCFIEGVDSEWESVAAPYDTLEALYENYSGKQRYLLDEYKSVVEYGINLFSIIPRETSAFEAVFSGNVMITGDIKGFTDRKSFIYAINKALNGLASLNYVEKRKTDVVCLIKEDGSPVTAKVKVAIESGIPIMTPSEFTEWVIAEVERRLKK